MKKNYSKEIQRDNKNNITPFHPPYLKGERGGYRIGLITSLLILAFAFAAVNDAQAAQVTFLRAGTGNDVTNTTTLPVPFPSPIASGNLILMQIAIRNTTIGVTTPTGWTLLYGPDTTGTTIRQWIFYKIADGSETGNLNVTVDSGNILKMGRMYLFNNTDSSNFTEGGGFGSGTANTISAQSVITTGIERLAVSFVFVDDDNALDPFTGESGGDWTEGVAEYTTTSGADGAMGLQIATMATAGTISGGTDTMGASDTWGVRAFALKPPPPAGVSNKLAFAQQPTPATAGVAISPNVAVEIQDSSGVRVNDNTTQVTISIGSNPGGGTLTGDLLTVTAVSGLVTFTNLKIDKGGTPYTLIATAVSLPNPTKESSQFEIRGPSKLAFSQQPTETTAGAIMSPAVTVLIQDSLGNTVTLATNAVTIAIGTNPGGGTLTNNPDGLTVNAVNGIATFSYLSINASGTGYTLTANATGLTPDPISSPFNILVSLTGPFGKTQCIADRVSDPDLDPGCTAGDVGITKMEINPTTPLTYCIGGETLILDLKATLDFGPNKYDIGIFIANDGKTLRYKGVDGGAQSCTVKSLPTSAPFNYNPDGDACGDSAPSSPPYYTYEILGVPIVCQANCYSSGNLFIPFSTSWNISSDPSDCSSDLYVRPNPSSKCNIPDTAIGTVSVAIMPKITKTDNRTTVSPGESTQYFVTITNNTGVPLPQSLKCSNGKGSCCGKALGNSCSYTDETGSVPGTCVTGDSLLFKDPIVSGLDVTSDPITCSASGGATCPADLSKSSMQGSGITITNMPSYGGRSIMGITQANPAVVTYSPDATEPVASLRDPYANGDRVILSDIVGMTEVNGREFTVANVNTAANTFQLSGVDSSSYTAYSSGGTILKTSSLTFTINATVSATNPPASFTNTATVQVGTATASASDTNGGSGSGTGGSRVKVIKWREIFR